MTIEEISRKIKLEELRTAEEKRRQQTEEADAKKELAEYYRIRSKAFKKNFFPDQNSSGSSDK